jgi:hypothetical protein
MCATTEGVVYVLWCCSDAPCHTWSCGWRGVLVLVVSLGIEGRGLGDLEFRCDLIPIVEIVAQSDVSYAALARIVRIVPVWVV